MKNEGVRVMVQQTNLPFIVRIKLANQYKEISLLMSLQFPLLLRVDW